MKETFRSKSFSADRKVLLNKIIEIIPEDSTKSLKTLS